MNIGGSMGTVVLKIGVVILSAINAVMWEFYTESPLMAAGWLAISVAFVVWAIHEIRNR
jgi:hypothetical protein